MKTSVPSRNVGGQIQPPPGHRKITLRTKILFLALILVLATWPFRDRLRRVVVERGALANDAPPAALIEEVIETAAEPHAAIWSAWNTGKIVHRFVALDKVQQIMGSTGLIPPDLEPLVLAGAFDPDLSVRELAFRILRIGNHPGLAGLAAAQLRDVDPIVRLLGLDYLKWTSAGMGVPTVMPLLDDTDPLVVVTGLKMLEKWTQQQLGVKLLEVAQAIVDQKSGLRELRADGPNKARAGAGRAKAWWERHQIEFQAGPLAPPAVANRAIRPVVASDFVLPALDGHKVRLSDFRGKVVLLHFWTTWYRPCISALPDFIALQQKVGNELAILGISLDNVPDSHGHFGGHRARAHQRDHDQERPSLKEVWATLERTVKASGVNYPVLLDEDYRVGGSFDAGELPTTVILDAQRIVRRRFTGRRTLPVLEAMVAEANQPANTLRSPRRD